MQYHLAGEDISVLLRFNDGDQPVVPDVGSVSYSVYDHSGVVISGYINVSVTTTTTDTQKLIILPSEINGISTEIEKRLVITKWSLNSNPQITRQSYHLTPLLNYSISPAEVRQELGCNINELPDEDIDIVQSYYQLDQILGSVSLNTLLATAGIKGIEANNALKYHTALRYVPSLDLRITESEEGLNQSFSRKKNIDYQKLSQALSKKLSEAISVSTSRTIEEPIIFSLITNTDIITGE